MVIVEYQRVDNHRIDLMSAHTATEYQ